MKRDSTLAYNSEFLQAPPSAFGTVEISSIKKRLITPPTISRPQDTALDAAEGGIDKAIGRPQDKAGSSR